MTLDQFSPADIITLSQGDVKSLFASLYFIFTQPLFLIYSYKPTPADCIRRQPTLSSEFKSAHEYGGLLLNFRFVHQPVTQRISLHFSLTWLKYWIQKYDKRHVNPLTVMWNSPCSPLNCVAHVWMVLIHCPWSDTYWQGNMWSTYKDTCSRQAWSSFFRLRWRRRYVCFTLCIKQLFKWSVALIICLRFAWPICV